MKHETVDKGITLALGGIGIHGALNVGLLQALQETRIPIKRIVATGVSAMIGAHFALGRDPSEVVPRITRFFEENRHMMWEIEQMGGLSGGDKRMAARSMSYFLRESLFCRSNMRRMGVFSWELVEDNLQQAYADRTTQDLKVPLSVSVIDIDSGEEKLLADGSVLDLIKAGIAFPGLFPPVQIAGRRYVSSATYCTLPLSSLSDTDRPIVTLSFPQRQEIRRPRSMIEVLSRVDEIRGNALTQRLLDKANLVIKSDRIGESNWNSFRRLDRAIPLVKEACEAEIAAWSLGKHD